MKRLAIVLIFLLTSRFTLALERQGETAPLAEDSFSTQVNKRVGQVLRKRDGLVIWIDRKAHRLIFFGNETLKDQNFPPGSLMKLITAQAALQKGEELSYRCTGRDEIGGKKYTCWTYKGHGALDLPKALAFSCNLYFANLGMKVGLDSLVEQLKAYGFSYPSAAPPLELPKFAIGDSPAFRVTPLQMASFWDRYLDFLSAPQASGIKQGLIRAVKEGTASRAGVSGLEILGKTGTSDSLNPGFKTDGWFLGALPADSPRFALLVFLREAHGFDEPASLAGEIFLLAKKLGVVEEGGRSKE